MLMFLTCDNQLFHSAPAPSLFGGAAAAPAFGAKPAGGGLFGSAPGKIAFSIFLLHAVVLAFLCLDF